MADQTIGGISLILFYARFCSFNLLRINAKPKAGRMKDGNMVESVPKNNIINRQFFKDWIIE